MAPRGTQTLPRKRGGWATWPSRALLRIPALGLVAIAAIALFAILEFGVRPAYAQFFGFGQSYERPRQRRPAAQQNFFPFPFIFGGQPRYQDRDDEPRRRSQTQRAPNESRAPPHRRPEVEPPKNVVVFGDSMADWLAFGLEEAFAEANELGVTRKNRAGAGLIRNDQREYDWVQAIKDALAAEKADFVVMMTGLGDRRAIRDKIDAKQPAPKDRRKPNAQNEPPADPEQTPATETDKGGGTHEFRSEKWVELYGKRIDEVMAALKAKRVPVIWVGLPSVRGARARQDIPFLNDIFRSSAEKAGIVYVDIWEGFIDDGGDFANSGPDVMGQVRRLRSADGVHFTRPGARKLAHYVDREIKRLLSRELPVALPIPDEPQKPETVPAGPAPRPVSGPVIALTGGAAPKQDALAGGGRTADAPLDPLARAVFMRGDAPPPLPGRADNFAWPSPYAVADNETAEPPALPVAAVASRPAARLPTAAPAAPAAMPARRASPSRPSAASAVGPARPARVAR
jgi:hypothetical protein